MAVFGIPEVREDDARRALVAAVAMHAAVTELGAEVASGADVRIGAAGRRQHRRGGGRRATTTTWSATW